MDAGGANESHVERAGDSVFSGLVAALRATTILLGRSEPQVPGRWMIYYPLVGLAIGGLMTAADAAGTALGGVIVGSLATVAVGVVVSGARPLIGLARTLAALVANRSRPPLERLGTARGIGVGIATGVVVVAELGCLLHLDRFRIIGLLFVPMLARCAMVVLAVGSRAARMDGRQVKFAPEVRFNEFALASTMTFAAVFLATEFLGFLLVLASAALTIGMRVFFHRWLGGVERTTLHAGCEAVQLLGWALLAAF
jgi:adenosylcobinamide-GDP ribazoletransferase